MLFCMCLKLVKPCKGIQRKFLIYCCSYGMFFKASLNNTFRHNYHNQTFLLNEKRLNKSTTAWLLLRGFNSCLIIKDGGARGWCWPNGYHYEPENNALHLTPDCSWRALRAIKLWIMVSATWPISKKKLKQQLILKR